ncbi:MAG TPA: glycosyltransferase, partial [Anaerolineae bacterium]|nr:glycosyltransferase [Anaerolineae bacterium]
MLIEWLITGQADEWVEENFANGGYVYDTYARQALRQQHEVVVTYVRRGGGAPLFRRTSQLLRFARRMRQLELRGDVVVRDYFSTIFAPFQPRRKHVVILHHFDAHCGRYPLLYHALNWQYCRKLRKADTVVVVSEYWAKKLQRRGVVRSQVIYNSYDLTQFSFSQHEVAQFRATLGAKPDRPLIYLGNARPEKGYRQAYEALRVLDADFVTTGRGQSNLPVIHVFLEYRDYLKLLACCDLVVTMSTFEEGWCRTAHEAMLCGTAVVGSGRGGMGELLTKGRQIVCPRFDDLLPTVRALLQNPGRLRSIAQRGTNYARQFSLSYFAKEW